jgi:muramidase (phage lysozyme)
VQALLASIRSFEGGKEDKAYDQLYFGAYKKLPKGTNTLVSKMKLREVLALQSLMIKSGSASSAAGAYQFLKKTLTATMPRVGATYDSVWDSSLQDAMAINLLKIRGIVDYLDGNRPIENFANNIAAEWASLPMVTGPKKGRSKYAGDGLNKSHHKVADILALINDIKVEHDERKGQ